MKVPAEDLTHLWPFHVFSSALGGVRVSGGFSSGVVCRSSFSHESHMQQPAVSGMFLEATDCLRFGAWTRDSHWSTHG